MLATIAYRLNKALDGCDISFYSFEPSHGVRSPIEILRHMSYVILYGRSVVLQTVVEETDPMTYVQERLRFLHSLKALDEVLEKFDIDEELSQKLLQALWRILSRI
jgi:hypothetical protein